MSHPRDAEIKRIVLYCKGLDIKVRIANYAWEDAGEFAHEPVSEININKRTHTSKTELILTLLHEISHHYYWIHTKIPIPEGENSSKRYRKKLYEWESNSLVTMLTLWTELQLKIPKWKVEMAIESDSWAYQFFYEHGRFPNRKERKQKNKELNLKYKGKA